MLKVTVVVEATDKNGFSEQFRAERQAPEHTVLRGWAPIHAEHLIAEVGAHLVRKVSAVYGDHRDDALDIVAVSDLHKLRPLTDYDKAREGNRAPGFRLCAPKVDYTAVVEKAITDLRATLDRLAADYAKVRAQAQQATGKG